MTELGAEPLAATTPAAAGAGGIPERIGNLVAVYCGRVGAVALAIIVAINGANVVGRYCFGQPLPWAEELMLYLMIFVVFIGAAIATWRGAHIGIDALVTRLPPGLQIAAHVAMSLLAIAILLTIANAGYTTVSMLYAFDQRSDALEWPMWIPQSFVVLGLVLSAALIALRLLVRNKPAH
jgi:TRAP-type C4-dicarboxylate transport system permease small subunit